MTHKRATAVVFASAMFMSIMDSQIVNVALAPLSRQFRASTASIQWVVIGYLLSLATCIPASGWLGARHGTRRMFLVAMVSFTAASGLCAASPSLPVLIAFRVLQGAGGGMLVPVAMAMLYAAYAPQERVPVARLITRAMSVAPAIAPLIGGLLITTLSWRWIFLVNLPVGAAVLLFAARYLEDHRQAGSSTYDIAGVLLGGPGLALLLYAVSEGPIAGWATARVWGTALAGTTLLICFWRAELRCPAPMLDLRLLLRYTLFRRSCVLQACSSPAFYGSLVFTTLYLQECRGYSALVSGSATFPEAIAIGVSSQLVARLYPKVGPRRLVMIGFGALAVTCLLFAQLASSTSLWLIRGLTFALGLGVSYIMLPVQAAAYAQIEVQETGHASAIYNSFQRTAQAVGIAVLSTVLAFGAGRSIHPHPPAFRAVYVTAAAFAALGCLLAARIRDADAAATMASRHRPEDPPDHD
jgi:EmrB/QacA subfamily drug resistance transporter